MEIVEFEIPFRNQQETVLAAATNQLPVAKMYIAQQMDMLTAQAWLCQLSDPPRYEALVCENYY